MVGVPARRRDHAVRANYSVIRCRSVFRYLTSCTNSHAYAGLFIVCHSLLSPLPDLWIFYSLSFRPSYQSHSIFYFQSVMRSFKASTSKSNPTTTTQTITITTHNSQLTTEALKFQKIYIQLQSKIDHVHYNNHESRHRKYHIQ